MTKQDLLASLLTNCPEKLNLYCRSDGCIEVSKDITKLLEDGSRIYDTVAINLNKNGIIKVQNIIDKSFSKEEVKVFYTQALDLHNKREALRLERAWKEMGL